MHLRLAATNVLLSIGVLTQLACSSGDGMGDGTGGDEPGTGGGNATGGSASGGSSPGTGGQDGETGGSGGGDVLGSGGAGTGGGSGPDGVADTCGPPASMNADGTLTPYPNIAVSLIPAEDYSLVSFNLISIEDGDERGPLLKIYAELKNESADLKCLFLPTVYLGFSEVVAVVDGEQYYAQLSTSLSSISDACIAPGETGIMFGAERGISQADLDSATSLEITPDPSTIATDYVAAAAPVLSDAQVVLVDGLYALSGTLTYFEDIYNQAVTVYTRDARGLLVDDITAYPGDLGTHLTGTTSEFETDGTTCEFVDYVLTQDWLRED